MKPSRYNFLSAEGDRYYVYQLLSGSLLQIDKDLFAALQQGNLADVPIDVQSALKESNFLVEDDVDEVGLVRAANLRARYRSPSMRVTIMPTLACNFKCWYCYEKHHASNMSEDAMGAVCTFMEKQLENNGKKGLTLDWFGGEPLLCFDRVVFPMQQRMVRWCAEHGVAFASMMTTNGSLITSDMAARMEEIGLRQFQITLDGGREFHNKTRFSIRIPDSYGVILRNIRTLCERIDSPRIELRINYTAANIESIVAILDDLDDTTRCSVTLSPHIVWQEQARGDALDEALRRFETKAQAKDFTVMQAIPMVRSTTCYTENADQFVVNYNLDVYKCTARDFDGKYSIGKIDSAGDFIPNGLYYKHLNTPSPFTEQVECLACELLPCCLCAVSCPQKQLEGAKPPCDKNSVKGTIARYVKRLIRQQQ